MKLSSLTDERIFRFGRQHEWITGGLRQMKKIMAGFSLAFVFVIVHAAIDCSSELNVGVSTTGTTTIYMEDI